MISYATELMLFGSQIYNTAVNLDVKRERLICGVETKEKSEELRIELFNIKQQVGEFDGGYNKKLLKWNMEDLDDLKAGFEQYVEELVRISKEVDELYKSIQDDVVKRVNEIDASKKKLTALFPKVEIEIEEEGQES